LAFFQRLQKQHQELDSGFRRNDEEKKPNQSCERFVGAFACTPASAMRHR
jgi:hypothetical protein